MKKLIITIIAGAIVVAGFLLLFHRASSRPPKVAFLRYEASSDGIVRAWFTTANPGRSFIVFKPQAEPSIATDDWPDVNISISAHGTATFGLPVRKTGTAWQLTLVCWRLQAQPRDLNGGQLAREPDLKVHGPVISASAPVNQNDARLNGVR